MFVSQIPVILCGFYHSLGHLNTRWGDIGTECLSNFKGLFVWVSIPFIYKERMIVEEFFFLVLSSSRNIIPYWPLGLEMLWDLFIMREIRLNWWVLQIPTELLVLKKQVCLEENYRIPNIFIASYEQYLIINILRIESLSFFVDQETFDSCCVLIFFNLRLVMKNNESLN